jgi:hypothetical protein
MPYDIAGRVKMQSLVTENCQHGRVHEIGEDFDEEGRMLRLVRCQRCGLLIREYLLAV